MQKRYDEIMQEVDIRVSVIDLNGKHIIDDCVEFTGKVLKKNSKVE